MFETALQKEVEQLTLQLLTTAGKHFGKAPGKVNIKFDLTGKAAGMAYFLTAPHRSSALMPYCS